MSAAPRIASAEVLAFEVPTERPESDGTLVWHSTTVVAVEVAAGDHTGLGYTYASAGAARLARDLLPLLENQDPLSIGTVWRSMFARVRNLSNRGLTQMALSAIDIALWDLKARLLDLSLVDLLGRERDAVPIYGSGGFTSYDIPALQDELEAWVDRGIPRVKMKVGREPGRDRDRVRAAREAIGDGAELYVDANGAYTVKEALGKAEDFASAGVTWFEEPVSSDDLEGLRLLRHRVRAPMEVVAGEYGSNLFYFRRMLEAGSLDVVQADLTRCGGITGFRAVAALCEAFHTPLSAHTAPQLHTHVCCAAAPVRHVEFFHDHVRIDCRFFDGVLEPAGGSLSPDGSSPGHGLTLKRADAESFAVEGGRL